MINRTPIEAFAAAIAAAGIPVPEHIEGDGELHRFSANGKAGDKAGWYVLHLDGLPAGIFGDWRTGQSEKWKADCERKLTNDELAAFKASLSAMKQQREEAEQANQEQTATKAATLWEQAQPAPDVHSYLTRTGIQPHGVKVGANGWLFVPMRDTAGKLWNLERIAPDKPTDGSPDKKGLYQGRRTGCYFALGNPKGAAAICIAEGFATGASIHEATGLPVAVAFNAGNLSPVAKALRSKLRDLPIMICGDDDYKTEGNPGKAKAIEAARSVGGAVVFPVFMRERPDDATDFNDLHQAEGWEAVQHLICGAVEAFTEAHRAEPHTEQESAAAGDSEGLAGNADPFPGGVSRPCYAVLDDWTEWQGRKLRPGVYHCTEKDETLTEEWFCSPLHIDAITYDGQDNNYGRILRFKNSNGRWREWAMPMELLAGDGSLLRGELLAMGLELDPYRAKQNLPAYLQRNRPKREMRCALQVGWSGKSFVLPDQVIGPDAAGVIFQSGERGHEEYTKAGTLEGWKEGVASKARGNPLLLMTLSAAFAGPLLNRCNGESGGVHIIGDSSTGKTTGIEAACSVWGGPNFKRSWRATSNGMEGAAALFNDGLLALDEISECDPKEVGAIIYSLGNGRGKQRAGRTGTARSVTTWRCMVLSSGERSIATTMTEGGHRVKAGQSVRMLDVPAERKYGAWDNLHGAASAAAFSDAIKLEAAQHYGLVGRAFLERLAHDETDYCAKLEEAKAFPLFAIDGGEGQDTRGAARFALIGMAGEIATEYGLTGWDPGEAMKAAAECFKLWRATRGKGNDEKRQIAEAVSSFIERHGDSRFSNSDPGISDPLEPMRINRAGWWRDTDGSRHYLFTTEGMREALKGFDFRRALDTLQALGALPEPEAGGERARFFRIGGRGMKLYPINPDKLTGGDHDA
jgi:putative DNA primase/helicase